MTGGNERCGDGRYDSSHKSRHSAHSAGAPCRCRLAVWRRPRASVRSNLSGNLVAWRRRQPLALRHQSTFYGRRDRTSRPRSHGFRRAAGDRGNGKPAIPAMARRTAGFGGPHAFRAGANRIRTAGLFHSFDRPVLWSYRHIGRGHFCPSATQAPIRALCCMDKSFPSRSGGISRSILGRRVDLSDPCLAAFLRNELHGPAERLCVLYARTDKRWCYAARFSQGHNASVAVRLRILVELGIRQNATSFLIAHGHPSGKVAPSGRDIEATRKLLAVAGALDLELIDHLIIAHDCIFSMRAGRPL